MRAVEGKDFFELFVLVAAAYVNSFSEYSESPHFNKFVKHADLVHTLK